ncbi:Hypothetical predicted protein [Olea europaea subsp. europaea]|uniref:Uncharacterized protein n=1 Tax=Olea europaea subsp. europaea TaxID=158383 RepID=A0A8S0UQ23_OLEEU|nr:Hypothetical predicted protein [Olea europaea subsp. europaea]
MAEHQCEQGSKATLRPREGEGEKSEMGLGKQSLAPSTIATLSSQWSPAMGDSAGGVRELGAKMNENENFRVWNLNG